MLNILACSMLAGKPSMMKPLDSGCFAIASNSRSVTSSWTWLTIIVIVIVPGQRFVLYFQLWSVHLQISQAKIGNNLPGCGRWLQLDIKSDTIWWKVRESQEWGNWQAVQSDRKNEIDALYKTFPFQKHQNFSEEKRSKDHSFMLWKFNNLSNFCYIIAGSASKC